ncbi:MAG: tetratricopeptide repeat protein [Spirochaetales bacterium]|nr:tetratricopeptide repeat protein [Spirochaetales bacterium]
MRFARSLALAAAALLAVVPVAAQSNDVTLTVLPTVALPIGPTLPDGLPYFEIGGGGTLRGEFTPQALPWLFGRAFLDYELLPITNSSQSVSFVSGGGALGASFTPTPRLSFRASAGAGVYWAMAEAGTVSNPFFEGGAELLLRLSPTLAASLGARYKYLTVPDDVLYQGVSMQLGLAYDLAGSRKGTAIELKPALEPVYPLFYSYYDANPLGTAVLVNGESLPVDKVRVEFYAKQYMDGPRLCLEASRLASGATLDVPVYALFNDSIFRVTEGTKAAGELTVEYYYLGRRTVKTIPVTLTVQNRNAMTWDDDRKAAAFVTAKDPAVLGFAKNVASMVRADTTSQALSVEFRTALGVFQALKAYGVGYAIDPNTPFKSLSEKNDEVDFLQFPGQTLSYRAGDCDDLSVLYAALLESVGVEAALVTVPGHIFVAFNSGLTPENAARAFSDSSGTIVRDDKVWVPVEVTMVKDGFVRAWSVAATEWRDGLARDQAGFYPIREAWKTYEPVGFSEGGVMVALPSQDVLLNSYRSELDKFSRNQIVARVASLQAQINSGKDADRAANRLGILYAQFGLLDDAMAQFSYAINKTGLREAMVNMGNVEFLQGDMAAARVWYERSLAKAPGDLASLVGLSRSLQALGDLSAFQSALAKLQEASPALVARYFPEGSSTARASEAVERNVELWNE